MSATIRPKAGPLEGKPVRAGGGVYVYRARKPGSIFGLLFRGLPWYVWPSVTAVACVLCQIIDGAWWFGLLVLLFTGRHFAYVGETVSFKDRHGEHMSGGGRWKRGAASWSDLDPKCVARIPLPRWKPVLRSVETTFVVLCAPVYNEKKNLLNPRRITRASAKRMRSRRDRRSVRLNFPPFRASSVLILIALVALVIGVF